MTGHVVDFVDVHIWPVFNVADSAVVVGAILLADLSVAADVDDDARPSGRCRLSACRPNRAASTGPRAPDGGRASRRPARDRGGRVTVDGRARPSRSRLPGGERLRWSSTGNPRSRWRPEGPAVPVRFDDESLAVDR